MIVSDVSHIKSAIPFIIATHYDFLDLYISILEFIACSFQLGRGSPTSLHRQLAMASASNLEDVSPCMSGCFQKSHWRAPASVRS
jgi:hypothetical protein